MSIRRLIVWLLVGVTVLNAFARLWGNWALFVTVLFAQAFFIFGGIYPYLFNRTMISFPGATDAEPVTHRDSSGYLKRHVLFLGHVAMYCLMFLAS